MTPFIIKAEGNRGWKQESQNVSYHIKWYNYLSKSFPRDLSNPNSLFMEMSENTDLKQVFLTTSDDEHLFIFLLDFCTSSLEKYLFNSFALFFFKLLSCMSSLYIKDVNLSYTYIFLPFCKSFYFVDGKIFNKVLTAMKI